MSTVIYILQRGRVRAYGFDDPSVALSHAEGHEREGALTSIVRNGRVLRRPRLPSSVAAKPIELAQHGDAHERF